MKVDVEIGMIVVEALPQGAEPRTLQAAIAEALAAHIHAAGVPGVAAALSAGPLPEDRKAAGATGTIGAQIARRIQGELGR